MFVVNGPKLRETRLERGLSLDSLQVKTGIPSQTIRRIEVGSVKNPGIITMTLITKALLIELDDVLIERKEGQA